MCHYRETIEVDDLKLYADWNTCYDTLTIYNNEGRVIFSGTDEEYIAVKKLFTREKGEYNSVIGNKFFKNIDCCN